MLPVPTPHPFKAVFRQHKVRLWSLATMVGVTYSTMSRYLSGMDRMPEDVEAKLEPIARWLDSETRQSA